MLIVGDVQVQYGPRDNGGDSDVVGKDFGVIGLGMPSCDRVDSDQADDRQQNHGCREDATVPLKFCEAIVLLGLASVLGRHRVYLAVKQEPQHAREEGRHGEIEKYRCSHMFSDSSASNQGASARHQHETTDGAEDPRREKRAEDAVFGRVRATDQHQRRRQR